MALSISFRTAHFTLAVGDCEENLRIGPLEVYLRWEHQGIEWRNRFDLLIQKDSYRPKNGKWVETWKESEEQRGGYFMGRTWNLLTGSRVAERASPSPSLAHPPTFI